MTSPLKNTTGSKICKNDWLGIENFQDKVTETMMILSKHCYFQMLHCSVLTSTYTAGGAAKLENNQKSFIIHINY